MEYVISFPLNNYRFIKFDFIDKNSLPINVLEVGFNKNNSIAIQNIELKDSEQKTTFDSKKKQTKVEIAFKKKQVIDGI
ncbi:hypothetical protein [Kaistella sp.]|uniref:hypothetical protein n=1 Tax=Kaistella sp. TaxID=2782235 RepID=UPI003C50BC6B